MRDRGLAAQLNGNRLTTAEILYRMPDHPAILQSFVWQCLDQCPNFPRINRFLDHWISHIDAEASQRDGRAQGLD